VDQMDTIDGNEYKPGKRNLLCMPGGSDLIASIKATCKDKGIETASFSIIGTVSSATIGVFDQKQQVYVTYIEKEATEILSCKGNVSQKNGSHYVTAKIILADQQGRLTGGHLFSETIISYAELDIQELLGEPLRKNDDS